MATWSDWTNGITGRPNTTYIDQSRTTEQRDIYGGAFETRDLHPDAAKRYAEMLAAPVWRMAQVCWALIALSLVPAYQWFEVVWWQVAWYGLATSVTVFGLAWWRASVKYHAVYQLFADRFAGVTERLTTPPPVTGGGPAVVVAGARLSDQERLEAQLRFVLIRAVYKPQSFRANEHEIIPMPPGEPSIRLDKESYRFYMYILRALGLVTGGKDPNTKRVSAWRCLYQTETEALARFEQEKGRLRTLDLSAIKAQADVQGDL